MSYQSNLQNPVITRTEAEGWPSGEWLRCPVCGEGTDTFYADEAGIVVGCAECLHALDAWEYEDLCRWK